MLSANVRKYLIALLITIIFYIIVVFVIATWGNKWIIALWSFPLLIFTILFFLERDKKEKLGREIQQCQYFILAYTILVVSLLAAYAMACCFRRRCATLVVALTTWLGLSTLFILCTRDSGLSKNKTINR